MTAEFLADKIRTVIEEFPPGGLVWHRACGKRGVVVEYAIDGTGCVMLLVCFGAGMQWDKCLPQELSGKKIVGDDDGEEWRGEEPEGKR